MHGIAKSKKRSPKTQITMEVFFDQGEKESGGGRKGDSSSSVNVDILFDECGCETDGGSVSSLLLLSSISWLWLWWVLVFSGSPGV